MSRVHTETYRKFSVILSDDGYIHALTFLPDSTAPMYLRPEGHITKNYQGILRSLKPREVMEVIDRYYALYESDYKV